jgi:hypothetical protein
MICLLCGRKLCWWQKKISSVVTANRYHWTCFWDSGGASIKRETQTKETLSFENATQIEKLKAASPIRSQPKIPGRLRCFNHQRRSLMAHKIKKLVAGLALFLMLGGCQATTGRTAGQNIDDSNTTAAVKTRLAQDKVSSLTRIDVDTNGGVVALNGTVESAEQRARAEQIVRDVGGVKRVINNLQVQQQR